MAMLEKVIQDIRTLDAQELHAVQNVVDEVLRERESQKAIGEPLMTEAEFAEYLAAKGVVTLPEPMSAEELAADDDDWEPIEVSGEPLSQMIIRERR